MLPVPKFLQKNQNDNKNLDQNQIWRPMNINMNNFQRPIQRSSIHGNFNNHGNKRKCNQDSNNIQCCDFDDCRFRTANKDEMLIHKKINHFQICKRFNDGFLMDSPEEISKWRAERRSKFPRLSNIINNDDGDGDDHGQKSSHPYRIHNQNYRSNNFRDRRKFQRHSFSSLQKNHSKNRPHNQIQRNPSKNERKNHIPSTLSKISLPTSEPCSSSSSSLNLLSGYASSSSSEHSDSDELKQNEHHTLISSMIDEIIDKVEKTHVIQNKNKNQNGNKTISNNNKKRTPKLYRQSILQYSNLNLFQKLMLQDVRKVKSELLQTLKLLVDTNFLETK
ncbi:uncharacterized protein LOC124496813 [Dermatophagoides farinae]|uniref:uncharacterized protein LOC124496813 n=1 Tax=Dermatophagoides farinae TaxID=6954 RepID=UPI003F5ECFF6